MGQQNFLFARGNFLLVPILLRFLLLTIWLNVVCMRLWWQQYGFFKGDISLLELWNHWIHAIDAANRQPSLDYLFLKEIKNQHWNSYICCVLDLLLNWMQIHVYMKLFDWFFEFISMDNLKGLTLALALVGSSVHQDKKNQFGDEVSLSSKKFSFILFYSYFFILTNRRKQ